MINRKKFEMRIDIPNAIRLNRKRFEANICARYLIWNKAVIIKQFCLKIPPKTSMLYVIGYKL